MVDETDVTFDWLPADDTPPVDAALAYVWHAEFHDCHSTDLTFTMETGHAKKAKH